MAVQSSGRSTVSMDIPLQEVPFYLMELVMRTARELTMERFRLEKIDLTIDQWVLLKSLFDREGQGQAELAESTFKDPAAITRMLDLLEKKQLLKREPDANDRRVKRLFLSAKGRNVGIKVIPIAQELRDLAMQNLSKAEIDRFKKTLRNIHSSLESG